MQKLQSFNYNGSEVLFRLDNTNVMLNATDMAKPYGKKTSEWIRLPSTNNFLQAMETMGKSHSLIVTIEGRNGGTWMHEDVALEFARWLNPRFAIWCNDRIKELLKHGATAMNPEDLLNPDFIINLATELKRERAEKELLSNRLEIQGKVIQESAPKVAYYQEVLQSESLIATNVIAKDLGMSAITLNQVLHNRGVIYKSGGVWVLYDKYQNKGYTKTKTTTFTDKLNETKTVIHTYWTEKGREFINSLFKVKATA